MPAPPEPGIAAASEPLRPFLKWAGGKKQLLGAFAAFYPALDPTTGYHEPFVGSGAVFFDVCTRFALGPRSLSDNNSDLMATFTAVRDDVEGLVRALVRHRDQHDDEHFYATRAILPDQLAALSVVERGARLIYLNKTCFNGLYRVNSRGIFNVPMGRYVDPAIVDPGALRAASAALRGVDLSTAPFHSVLDRARAGDLVYFDPPYVPLSPTASFTAYTGDSFGARDQRELAFIYRALDARGCHVMLSNSDTPFVRELYRGFDLREVLARRSINSKGDRRGNVGEVVVLNYQPGDRLQSPAPRRTQRMRKNAAHLRRRAGPEGR